MFPMVAMRTINFLPLLYAQLHSYTLLEFYILTHTLDLTYLKSQTCKLHIPREMSGGYKMSACPPWSSAMHLAVEARDHECSLREHIWAGPLGTGFSSLCWQKRKGQGF